MQEIDLESKLPVGGRVKGEAAKLPRRTKIEGRYIVLVPLDVKAHGEALWEATQGVANSGLWQYLFDGPFTSYGEFHSALQKKAAGGIRFFSRFSTGNRGALRDTLR